MDFAIFFVIFKNFARTVLLHDLQEFDDNLGGGADEHLALTSAN